MGHKAWGAKYGGPKVWSAMCGGLCFRIVAGYIADGLFAASKVVSRSHLATSYSVFIA